VLSFGDYGDRNSSKRYYNVAPTVQLIIPAAAFITYVTNDEYNQNKNKLKPRVHCFLNIARLCTNEQDNLYIELP